MASITSSDTDKSRKASVSRAVTQARGTWLGQLLAAWGRLRAAEGASLRVTSLGTWDQATDSLTGMTARFVCGAWAVEGDLSALHLDRLTPQRLVDHDRLEAARPQMLDPVAATAAPGRLVNADRRCPATLNSGGRTGDPQD